MVNAIEIAGLSKSFKGRPAVIGLDLCVKTGTVTGLLGHNGAGKSTTIGALIGLVQPDCGTVRVQGHDVLTQRKQALAKVGAIFESPAFWPYLSGWQCLQGLLACSGVRLPRAQIEETVAWVGLADRIGDRVATYSHGMRQRLGLAQALLPQPELLILDEPTNGLDPRGIHEMRGLIRRLHTERGMTLLLCSHMLHEVEQICSHVAILHQGRKVHDGLVCDTLGDARRVRIECDRPAEAAGLLARLGLAESVGGESFHLLNGHEPADVAAALVGGGFRVQGLARERTSLESFYMGLTGGDAGGGAA